MKKLPDGWKLDLNCHTLQVQQNHDLMSFVFGNKRVYIFRRCFDHKASSYEEITDLFDGIGMCESLLTFPV